MLQLLFYPDAFFNKHFPLLTRCCISSPKENLPPRPHKKTEKKQKKFAKSNTLDTLCDTEYLTIVRVFE